MPSCLPWTVPCVNHSSDALNSSRWFFSHIALCEEQARSTNTFFGEPKSLYNSRTRSGFTCLSCAPETISTGICVFETAAVVHPQEVTCGARRTPLPQVAPTGSEASISDQTESLVGASY